MKIPRIRLSADEHALIKQLRKKGVASELVNQCDEAGLPLSNVKHFWYKSEKFSIFSKTDGLQLEDVFDPIIKDVQLYSPKFRKIKRSKIKNPHCLILDPSDIHVGKLAVNHEAGESYDVKKAVSIVDSGIDSLLQKAAGFPLDKIIFVIGNDCLHIDSSSSPVTTGGTSQDMDGKWHDAFLAARDMYIRAIEKCLPLADVEIIFCPSNHDFMSGFMLAQTIKAYFRKSKNITFDVSIAHRKYTSYGKNLLSFSHGDGAKIADTPLLMATERPEMWSNSVHRYIYLHHIHHKQTAKFMTCEKDFIGVTAEYLRSPSASDAWHAKKGYRSPKAVEAFIHNYDNGQVARLTHYVDTDQKVCKCGVNLYHHYTRGWMCERCDE
jgi:hypothetical protein